LFNSKKKAAAAEAERAQQARVAALQVQLDEERSARASLEARIAAIGETGEELDKRLDALDQDVHVMGDQLVTLSSSSTETSRHLHAIDERVGQVEALGTELEEINERLQTFSSAPPPRTPTPPPPPPPLIAADTPDELNERIAELRGQLDDLTQQTSSIDARVTNVSMELANQLTELSSDIDELNRRRSEPTDGTATASVDTAELEARISEQLDAALDDVLESTERLAAEQARYEIQFRADLADLAERLRRPGTG